MRHRRANSVPVQAVGEFVIYWMTAQRRPFFNFALERAVEWARKLNKPLLVLEALRYDYPWACPRFHRFVADGMEDNFQHFLGTAATYFPYIEPEKDHSKGLLAGLAARACLVVGDEYPCFFLPRLAEAAAALPVCLELVDGNGLLPLRAAPKCFERAVDFRRFLQKSLAGHLRQRPLPDPLAGVSLPRLPQQYEMPLLPHLSGPPVVGLRGGHVAAQRVLDDFVQDKLKDYHQRSEPGIDVASGLSPYLHFGHVSVHQILEEVAEEGWSVDKIRYRPTGTKEGSWGMSGNAEAFLDELVTWRELGFNFCHFRRDYGRYESLPGWARQTLEEHAADPRPELYDLEELDRGKTGDAVWNAAQRQLREEGRIHNYMRMLWGKKILEWSPDPRRALQVMIELNNQYALDGRDPNSYSGIFWCLGRYDRPWFERPIFGTVRYMSTSATARKFKSLKQYLERWG